MVLTIFRPISILRIHLKIVKFSPNDWRSVHTGSRGRSHGSGTNMNTAFFVVPKRKPGHWYLSRSTTLRWSYGQNIDFFGIIILVVFFLNVV